jgi:hypothetical protein
MSSFDFRYRHDHLGYGRAVGCPYQWRLREVPPRSLYWISRVVGRYQHSVAGLRQHPEDLNSVGPGSRTILDHAREPSHLKNEHAIVFSTDSNLHGS